MKLHYLIPLFFLFVSCTGSNEESIMREKVTAYFQAWNNQEFTSDAFRGFTTDTTYTWHGEKREMEVDPFSILIQDGSNGIRPTMESTHSIQ